jgi:hypothetical protein
MIELGGSEGSQIASLFLCFQQELSHSCYLDARLQHLLFLQLLTCIFEDQEDVVQILEVRIAERRALRWSLQTSVLPKIVTNSVFIAKEIRMNPFQDGKIVGIPEPTNTTKNALSTHRTL